jgi:hypothetical protein
MGFLRLYEYEGFNTYRVTINPGEAGYIQLISPCKELEVVEVEQQDILNAMWRDYINKIKSLGGHFFSITIFHLTGDIPTLASIPTPGPLYNMPPKPPKRAYKRKIPVETSIIEELPF